MIYDISMLNCCTSTIKMPKLTKVAALIHFNILEIYKKVSLDLKVHVQTILKAWNQVATQSLGLFPNDLYLTGCSLDRELKSFFREYPKMESNYFK